MGRSTPSWATTALVNEIIGYRADGRPVWAVAGGDGGVAIEVGEDDGDDRPRGGRRTALIERDGDVEDLDADVGDEPGSEPGGGSEDGDPDGESEEGEGEPDERDRTIAALRDKLSRANYEAALRKKHLRRHGIDPRTGDRLAGEPADDTPPADEGEGEGEPAPQPKKTAAAEIRRAEQRGESRAMERLMPVLAGQALEAALRAAGWSGSDMSRVVRLIDFDMVDIEEGQVVGIVEQVDELKGDFPEWFRPARPAKKATPRRAGAAAVDGTDRGARPPTKRTNWVERIDSRWRGMPGA